MRIPRVFTMAALAVLLSALAGGFFGARAQATQDQVAQQYHIFTAALAAVDREYVEPVASDRIIYDSINGMLQTLDPHSSFFDPKQYALMRERQTGSYYGIGLSILTINGDVTAMSVFEGSPAHKAGLRRGDVIARVNGQSARNWTTDETAAKLKGPKGTKVNISIRRPGYDQLIDMEVERDAVNIVTVQGVFMLDQETGYIKLGDFSETSGKEVSDALDQLKSKGMKRLVFDLRDNPGGPLDQAIRIANFFIPRGELIVYLRGRVPNLDQDYRGEDDPIFSGPMIVLTSRNSASASEIVSGALQDHDRALIVGEETFGKALVQSVYKISEGAGLALTTGRYFTPSGRMIQRPWDQAFDEYLTYSMREQTGQREHSAAQLKYTDAGRKVFGGGGITPDVKYENPHSTTFQRRIAFSSVIYRFASKYFGPDKPALPVDWQPDDQLMARFKDYLQSNDFPMTNAEFEHDKKWLREQLRDEFYLRAFDKKTSDRAQIVDDPEVAKAVEALPQAQKLHADADKLAPRRM